MPNRVRVGPESLRWIRHWAAELATVAIGVLLSVLRVDGPLGEDARDRSRQDPAWLGSENQVTVQRARSLARLAGDRGVTLSAARLAEYPEKVERDWQPFGDRIAGVPPVTLESLSPVLAPGH